VADSKPRSTGAVYRDEAADLMAAAARSAAPAPEIELTARRAPAVERVETRRPLPYAEPVGINDNAQDRPAEIRPAPRTQRRRLSILQLLAWIVIAPVYLTVAAGALFVIALFGKGLLGV
jgi:hypothetical protein